MYGSNSFNKFLRSRVGFLKSDTFTMSKFADKLITCDSCKLKAVDVLSNLALTGSLYVTETAELCK